MTKFKRKNKIETLSKKNNYYEEMNIRRQKSTFHFEEDLFSKNVQGTGKVYHEVLLIMKFLQTKPQVKNMKIWLSWFILQCYLKKWW